MDKRKLEAFGAIALGIAVMLIGVKMAITYASAPDVAVVAADTPAPVMMATQGEVDDLRLSLGAATAAIELMDARVARIEAEIKKAAAKKSKR